MFHKRPFLHSRFPPQGTAMVLRARNENYLDILFRIHAEFQLNEPPYLPFWFSPASFNGRLIIAMNFSHIEHFNLYVPNEKKLNVDMEWLNDNSKDDENMEVDIGYIVKTPSWIQLKWITFFLDLFLFSHKWNWSQADLQNCLTIQLILQIHFKQVIQLKISSGRKRSTLKKASLYWKKLFIHLNKFVWALDIISMNIKLFCYFKVSYLPYLEAFKEAIMSNKLVHFILLWGSLDDQSCWGSGRTLRETALESSAVINLLKEKFVSTWSLIVDLKVNSNSTILIN